MEKQLIFITGGARSGKSTFAEKCAITHALASGGSLYYIATSKPSDNEMVNRILHHQKQRQNSGENWKLIECPVDLSTVTNSFDKEDIVLIDCLTILLTNELFRGNPSNESLEQWDYQESVMKSILSGIDSIQDQSKVLIIVSNEVLNEYVSDNSLVQTYSRLLGTLHQHIVKMADKAYVVEAGIPIVMKGEVK